MEGAHADLVKGRVDAVLGEAPVLEAVMLNVPGGQQFGFVGPSLSDPQWFGNGFGIAVRPDDTRLRQRLNEAITAIRAKGIYQNIAAPYFNYDVYGR
ncbi:amino acid ABC transporter periplasmic amino acid-binding protein [Photobacterium aphoticum]|uniref:Amino acid ABC transporter periplasmic amino acid-binding protein n=1 Tax=Photobacterium aphoticum TaxID=754436 RepID=A0A090RL05_9GAMM|nr:amino acid ABC transporter periplasmic amino acid-binding protein [Photobacterium aphoticum]